MNLPNQLTILRVLLIPVCLALLALGLHLWAAVVFAAASITDWVDGRIARKHNLVTNFGKFADPVADKLLVLTALIALSVFSGFPWWATCCVAVRELAVDGLRLVAVEQGIVIAAKMPGKIKTASQMLTVLCAMLAPYGIPDVVIVALAAVMTALTLWSGAVYFKEAWPALKA